MCESVPPECLPAPERAVQRPLARRRVLMGLGGLLLASCMPTSVAQQRRQARGPDGSAPCPPPARPPSQPAPPPYVVVPRAGWGAESLKDNHDPMERITRLTVHHTAEIAGMGERTDADLMKGIQDFHRNKRGWADIGYHFVIGRDGKVYEGRGLSIQGAHAGGGNNKENLGISVIGDFSTAMPTSAAIRTLSRFLRAAQQRYGIGMDQVFGHREFKATACPGDSLFSWVERYRARA